MSTEEQDEYLRDLATVFRCWRALEEALAKHPQYLQAHATPGPAPRLWDKVPWDGAAIEVGNFEESLGEWEVTSVAKDQDDEEE